MKPIDDERIQVELKGYAKQDRDQDAREYIDALDIPEAVRTHYHKLYRVMSEDAVVLDYLRSPEIREV